MSLLKKTGTRIKGTKESLEEKQNTHFIEMRGEEDFHAGENEFNRRDFLKIAGFSFAAGVAMVGCVRPPVEKAIPFLIQPEEIIPGKAYWYASTCGGCSAGCGILVKNRDGRPTKLEGNPDHPLSHGGLCAIGQASILGLYDSRRLKQPLIANAPADWTQIDSEVISKLSSAKQNGGKVRILTGTVNSPTEKQLTGEMLSGLENGKHIEYDAVSSSAVSDAHLISHNKRIIPRYFFERADVIVSFDCDFLDTWISPVEHTSAYAEGRDVERGELPEMSLHIQFEGRLTVTGSKADQRVRVTPDEITPVLVNLANILSLKAGVSFPLSQLLDSPVNKDLLNEIADKLWGNRGKSLVVCGNQDISCQLAVNFINHLLGSYGNTIDVDRHSNQRSGNDKELSALIEDIHKGEVDLLIINGVNPVFDLHDSKKLGEAIKKIPLVVNISPRVDETCEVSNIVCAESHYLENWSDSEPVEGIFSVSQPTINKFGDTRAFAECLSAWLGTPKSAFDLISNNWRENIFPKSEKDGSFQAFWDRTVHDGYIEMPSKELKTDSFDRSSLESIETKSWNADNSLSLVLYSSIAMREGRHSYNPFLLELPDPISKVTWDNCLSVSPERAEKMGAENGDIVSISIGESDTKPIQLPLVIQPGQHENVIAAAIGFGSKETVRFKDVNPQWIDAKSSVGKDGYVGKNVAGFSTFNNGLRQSNIKNAQITLIGKGEPLAFTQEHNSLDVRDPLLPAGSHRDPIIKEGTLTAFRDDPHSVVPHTEHEGDDLWGDDHQKKGHFWGMAIDLNRCTGCEACVVSCQIENNIPVVGKDEVRRNREMHWLRIDRYYNDNDGDVSVVFQPMMCQHCENAPCETVCPVLATVHSSEGLNQQIYNRCVGTRYCSNNCPYKMRRFNWFNYAHEDEMQNLLLNPDVTVRSRGIMEKCTFCVQRIQEAKIDAKSRGVKVNDRSIKPACQQSCPANAIVFGDMNDPESQVAKLLKSQRKYRVLEEINVRPSVGYLAMIRNKPESDGGMHHG